MEKDLIRRSDAIKVVQARIDSPYMQNAWQQGACLSILRAIEELPSADKPTVIRVKSIMKKEDYDNLEKRIKQQNPNVIVIPHNAELVTTNAELVTTAGRPQGEWIGEADGYYNGELVYDTWCCSNCDYVVDDDEPPTWNFCPNCGARMKGADDE